MDSSTSGEFKCPEGTRIIIQRPDGYFTALVTGTVRITHLLEDNGSAFMPQTMVRESRVSADLKCGVDDNHFAYQLGSGQYSEAV